MKAVMCDYSVDTREINYNNLKATEGILDKIGKEKRAQCQQHLEASISFNKKGHIS